jgi:hypothetical protein
MTIPPVTTSPMLIKKDSGLAIASLITGIVGWMIIPIFGSLAAIITGHLAKKEIKESNGMLSGGGMATAGLILGYIQWGFILLGIIVIVVLALLAPSISNIFNNISSQLGG